MWEVKQGHVLDVLKMLPAESAYCVVTSPPYWGLRSYKTEPQVWVGWQPTCRCDAAIQPCLVLDPFCGSGTTGVVALKLGRSFIGLELLPAYVEMSRKRIGAVMPLFDRPSSP